MNSSQYQAEQNRVKFTYQGQRQGEPIRNNHHLRQTVVVEPARNIQSKMFQPFKRVASLPPKKMESDEPPFQESHIKIVQTIAEAAQQSKLRKRKKIFDQTAPKQRPSSVINIKQVQTGMITPPKIVNQVQQQEVTSPLIIQKPQDIPEIEQRVYNRILDKLTRRQVSPIKESNPSVMAQKQQEIQFLKLQVQRLKRCQKLSKQNDSLYRRLVQKLNSMDASYISSLSKSRNKLSVVQRSSPKKIITPNSSYIQNDQNGTKTQNNNEAQVIVNKRTPQKHHSPVFADHSQIYHSLQNSTYNHNKSDTLTFSRPHKRSHPKVIKPQLSQTCQRKTFQLYTHMKQRDNIYDMPVTQRLSQINGQLQNTLLSKKIQRLQRPPSKYKVATKTLNWTTMDPIHQIYKTSNTNYSRHLPRQSTY